MPSLLETGLQFGAYVRRFEQRRNTDPRRSASQGAVLLEPRSIVADKDANEHVRVETVCQPS
jgi:hypothetical protein